MSSKLRANSSPELLPASLDTKQHVDSSLEGELSLLHFKFLCPEEIRWTFGALENKMQCYIHRKNGKKFAEKISSGSQISDHRMEFGPPIDFSVWIPVV